MYDEYQVIAIEDEHTILINYGFFDNAKAGDSLRIIEPGKELIIDNINYGRYDGVKAIIEVVTPYEKFSVCQRIVRNTVKLFSPISALEKSIARSTPLTVKKEDISKEIAPPKTTPIKVGDTAILTRE